MRRISGPVGGAGDDGGAAFGAGGYATAFERGRDKYRFEVSLHGTSIHNNQPAKILQDLGVLENLELVRLPDTYRIKTASGDVVVPQSDPEGFIRTLSGMFPREADGIRGFVNEMLSVHAETEAYGGKSVFSKKYLKLLFPLMYPTMWKMRSKTLSDLLDAHVQATGVRDLLSFLWGYYGLPPSRLSGFYYALAAVRVRLQIRSKRGLPGREGEMGRDAHSPR